MSGQMLLLLLVLLQELLLLLDMPMLVPSYADRAIVSGANSEIQRLEQCTATGACSHIVVFVIVMVMPRLSPRPNKTIGSTQWSVVELGVGNLLVCILITVELIGWHVLLEAAVFVVAEAQ